MKLSRQELQNLIKEVRYEQNSVLLEMPIMSTTGSKMGAHDPPMEENDLDDRGDSRSVQDLYLMARKLDQLHDMLKSDDSLDPPVREEIDNLNQRVTQLLDDIMYDKENPRGR